MIELNAATLTAPDILSLIPTLEAPAESTNSSATPAQDFSAMLTEMIGSALPAAVSSASALTIAGPAQSTTLSATMPQNITVQTAQPTPAQPAAAALTVQAALPQQPALTAQTTLPQQPALTAQTTLPQQPALTAQTTLPQQPAQPAAPVAAAPIELPLPQMPPQPTQRLPIQAQPIPAAPAPSDVTPDQTNEQTATVPRLQIEQELPKSLTPEKPKDPAKTQDPQTAQPAQKDPTPVVPVLPFVPVAVASCAASGEKPVSANETQSQQPKVGDPAVASAPIALPPALQQEVQRAWADVKKFDFKVQVETTRPAQGQPQVAVAEVPKQAIVTTDPIANIQLQQLPPRITAIEKLAPEARLADRAKPEAEHQTSDGSTAAPVVHFADMTQPVEHVEQAQAAHTVEIPNLPHVHVLRTVSMEVGDADSQVTVHIQERAGDISMEINTGSEPLHEGLQSSVGSLVNALKQEQVQVSNVQVSRKSPIEKVRRMKEAN